MDGQGIHIGAQPYHRPGGTVSDDPDHTGSADTGVHLDSEFTQIVRDQFSRPGLGKGELGMGMDIAPNGGQTFQGSRIQQGHTKQSHKSLKKCGFGVRQR